MNFLFEAIEFECSSNPELGQFAVADKDEIIRRMLSKRKKNEVRHGSCWVASSFLTDKHYHNMQNHNISLISRFGVFVGDDCFVFGTLIDLKPADREWFIRSLTRKGFLRCDDSMETVEAFRKGRKIKPQKIREIFINNTAEEWVIEKNPGPKCFNCGSDAHMIKECPAPRVKKVVNKSRKRDKKALVSA